MKNATTSGPPVRLPSGEVLSLLAGYHSDSAARLHLVPSENRLSLAARLPHLTEAATRYAFPAADGGRTGVGQGTRR